MSNRLHVLTAVAALVVLSVVTRLPGEPQATDRAQLRAHVGALLGESQDYLAAEQYDSARVTLNQVLEIEPRNQDAFYYLAASYLAQADTSQAMEVLADGLAKSPMSSRIRLLTARLHINAGQYVEADDLIASTLRFKPNNPEAIYLRGLSLLARADTSAALADWEAALEKAVKGGRKR